MKALASFVIFASALSATLSPQIPERAQWEITWSCLSSGGKVQRVIIRHDDVTYAAFFTSFMS
jgi:hypothetical protein